MSAAPQQVQESIATIFDYLEAWKGSEVDVAKPDDEQWEGEGFPEPFDNGLGYLRLYLVSARHHLLGASHLLTCKAFLGEDTLTRASIEASASAYHLAKNWADPAKFVKAAAVDRIWSLEERRKLFDGETKPEVVTERTRTVERAEAARQYGVKRKFWDEDLDVKTIARQRNATDLCKALFKNTAAMSDDKNHDLYYRYFSGAAHSNPSLMISRGQVVGESAIYFQPTDEGLMLPLIIGVLGLITASNAVSVMTSEPLEPEPFEHFRTLAIQ